MGISDSLEISASGLTAERLRMDVIANNIANVNTTRVAGSNKPYRRKQVVLESADTSDTSFVGMLSEVLGQRRGRASGGVRVAEIADDQGPFRKVYDPGNPDADPKTGYVLMPNVEPVMEMVDLMSATRAYEAGISVIDSAKQMESHALEIGKG